MRMTVRNWGRLFAAVVVTVAVSLTAYGAQPNILVIVADDLGADALSCYGSAENQPNMHNVCGLADGGTLFENGWTYPLCTPSRAAMQTGRYGFRTGVFRNNLELPFEEQTLAEVFQEHPILGYTSAAIGKWHLGNNGSCTNTGVAFSTPGHQGYDFFAGTGGNIGSAGANYVNWCRWKTDFRVVPEDGTWLWCTNGLNNIFPECHQQGNPLASYATFVTTNDALSWISDQTGPWFLWLAYNEVHEPIHRPPDQCPNGPCHSVPFYPSDNVGEGGSCPTYTYPCPSPTYPAVPELRLRCWRAMAETMDKEIGRLLSSLPPTLGRETWVIFVGDNGSLPEFTYPRVPCDRAKYSVYEHGVHVPLIIKNISSPGPTNTIDQIVNSSDLFATILFLAGIAPPAGPDYDSVSLKPLIDTSSPDVRKFVFSEICNNIEEGNPSVYWKTARDLRYKLIFKTVAGAQPVSEFYDLEADPLELKNLTDLDPGQATHYTELWNYLSRMGADLQGFPCP